MKIDTSSGTNYGRIPKSSKSDVGISFSDIISKSVKRQAEQDKRNVTNPITTDYFEKILASHTNTKPQETADKVGGILTEDQKRMLQEKYPVNERGRVWTKAEQEELMNDLKELGVIEEDDWNRIVNADFEAHHKPISIAEMERYKAEHGSLEGFDMGGPPPRLRRRDESEGSYDYYYRKLKNNDISLLERYHFNALRAGEYDSGETYKLDRDSWMKQAAAFEKVSYVMEQIF